MKRLSAAMLVALATSLIPGCVGHSHWGMSDVEQAAMARSDSACDTGSRSSRVGDPCYVPRRGERD